MEFIDENFQQGDTQPIKVVESPTGFKGIIQTGRKVVDAVDTSIEVISRLVGAKDTLVHKDYYSKMLADSITNVINPDDVNIEAEIIGPAQIPDEETFTAVTQNYIPIHVLNAPYQLPSISGASLNYYIFLNKEVTKVKVIAIPEGKFTDQLDKLNSEYGDIIDKIKPAAK